MTVRNYSTIAANNNSAPPNGWPEGQAPSTINDCARQLMAEVRETFEEAPYFDWGDTPTRIDNTNFSVPTDLTARYAVGTRVKLVGATTGYGRITASVFGAVTTVNVVMDSGNVPVTLTRVAVTPVAAFGSLSATSISATSITLAGTAVFSGASPAVSLASNEPRFWFNQLDGAGDGKIWDWDCDGTTLRLRTRTDADGAGNDVVVYTRNATTVTKVSYPTDTAAAFVVGPAPAVTVNNPRATFTTSTASAHAAQFTNAGGTNSVVGILNPASAVNSGFISFYTNFSSLKGSITYNSGTDMTSYNTTSDQRLKKNIRDSPDAGQLIDAIQVRAFEWIENPAASLEFWLVAQELYEVMPSAVFRPEEPESFWSIDPSKLVPLMLKELQTLRARVGELERQLVRA